MIYKALHRKDRATGTHQNRRWTHVLRKSKHILFHTSPVVVLLLQMRWQVIFEERTWL